MDEQSAKNTPLSVGGYRLFLRPMEPVYQASQDLRAGL